MKKKIVLKNWVINSLVILGGFAFGIFLALLYVGVFSVSSASILTGCSYLLVKYGA